MTDVRSTCDKMGDSDEEYDRSRSRDKFRRERSDYGEKSRSKSDYRERRGWREDYESSRRRSRDDDDRDRRRYSPHRWSPPPPKRMRREGWESFHDYPGMMGPYGLRPPWMHHDLPPPPHQMPPGPGIPGEMPGAIPPGPKRHTMLTFKQFLAQQDDGIDVSEAITKYNEYKSEFKRKQIAEFFDEHKDEDWLISKYHPKMVQQQREASAANLQDRLRAFLFLLESGKLDAVPLNYSRAEEITKVMDAAVIVMEGGSDSDLLALDQSTAPGENGEEGEEGKGEEEKAGEKEGKKEDKLTFMVEEPTEEQKQLAQQAMDYGRQMQALSGDSEAPAGKSKEEQEEEPVGKKRGKRKRPRDLYAYSEGDESEGSSSESETEGTAEEPPPPGLESDPPPPGMEGVEPPPPGMEEPATGEVPSSSSALPETGQTEETGEQPSTSAELEPVEEVAGLPPPRPLHLTRSVYIRHIPPKISEEDIMEVCRTIPGYLRIAFAEPAPEKGYERRGWVTYKNDTDIREALARLNTTKIKDCQLNCMVNRELTRRVKPSLGGVVWARKAVHTDLHLMLRLAKALDEKNVLWERQPSTGEEEEAELNPVLTIPPSILAEEGEGEGGEPMVTGVGGGVEEEEGVVSDPGTEVTSDQDEKVKVLDRLIWYLRIVHSVDYYNGTTFPSEDCMPHRCGIVTARGQKPTSITQDDVSEYTEGMESKVKPLLEVKKELSEEEMEKYSKKDPEVEVERFVEVNTQRLSDSKYLCPLSGKKFKGPEFVRKHIFNKHVEKVDAVRQEAEFFNNYLRDPDRPMPLEASVSSSVLQSGGQTPGTEEPPAGPVGGPPGVWGGQGPQMMVFGRGGFHPGMGGFPMMGRGQFRRGGRRGGRGRRVIQYHDLDAPEEMY